jgi:predicted nuclease of predicted toxin-antitoxin system
VQLRADDVNPDVVGPKVLAAIRQMEAELQAGALLTVDSNRTRLRLLPLVRRD